MIREETGFRLARFRVPEELVRMCPESVLDAMKDVLIVRAELLFATNAIEYVGMCERFDIANPTEEPPDWHMDRIMEEMEVDGKTELCVKQLILVKGPQLNAQVTVTGAKSSVPPVCGSDDTGGGPKESNP